ncbi:hypothetical protein EV651_12385 [Kribbella sp. VKM Ac-2571]|uniref:hypothetical protein n=1 Tax=Kribbella sp. VKM Ac-2571 TaxID=2512222 RepID=UPI00105B9BBF|nr:hypothetical protein [Kribbella sp. VKM Ac-2571]TDO48319.1 hypothetical protein EV651_12385 [Kribbella sp. VKM Ac-2571]
MITGYLDRLAHSSHFDSWQTEELKDALVTVDDAILDSARPTGHGPGAVSIRFEIYRQRLQRELDHRAAASDL